MQTFEILATVRMHVASVTPHDAENAATDMLNEIVSNIEHIEVK
jgi:hypothetical protein